MSVKRLPKSDPRIIFRKKTSYGYEVSYPVSYTFNGGPSLVVDPPVNPPKGWVFVDIACGMDYNQRPPHVVVGLEKESNGLR